MVGIIKLKNLLRAKIKKDRRSFKRERYKSRNDIIVKSVQEVLSMLQSRIKKHNAIGLYFSMNGEPDLSDLMRISKWCVLAPKLKGEKMYFVRYKAGSPLEKSGLTNLIQPKNDNELEVNIVVIPALAFDINGYRLGFGRGHYDKYLSNKKEVIKIGVCFHKDLYEELPRLPHDVKLDYIITEKTIIAL